MRQKLIGKPKKQIGKRRSITYIEWTGSVDTTTVGHNFFTTSLIKLAPLEPFGVTITNDQNNHLRMLIQEGCTVINFTVNHHPKVIFGVVL